MNPFHYRPPAPDLDGDGKTVDEWADNALSNFLAWASVTFTPGWCEQEDHWTTHLMDYLYTTCPCCMLFRGLVLGILGSSVIWLVVSLLLLMIVRH